MVKWLKYWYATRIQMRSYAIVFTVKEVICTLPPVIIGDDMELAQGMETIRFTKEELAAQGKFAVGKPIKFPVGGCIRKETDKRLTWEIMFNGLQANAYSALIEKKGDKTYAIIQPYSI